MMNKDQVSALEMFLAVERVASEYHTLWRKHYGFRSAFHLFSGRLLHIRRIIRKLEKLNLPPPSKVPKFRARLENLAYIVSKGLLVYGLTHDDTELIDKLDFVYSDFKVITCEELMERSRVILDEGIKHYQELKTYEVSLSHLADLEHSVERLHLCTGGEHVSMEEREKLEEHLDGLMDETRTVLKEHLDPQAMTLKWVYKAFYDQYKEARGIHTVYAIPLQGYIVDDATHMPVGNADVTIRELHLTRHITPMGHFRFYNLPPGRYHAMVHKYGYEDREVEVDIKDGEGTNVEISLHHL